MLDRPFRFPVRDLRVLLRVEAQGRRPFGVLEHIVPHPRLVRFPQRAMMRSNENRRRDRRRLGNVSLLRDIDWRQELHRQRCARHGLGFRVNLQEQLALHGFSRFNLPGEKLLRTASDAHGRVHGGPNQLHAFGKNKPGSQLGVNIANIYNRGDDGCWPLRPIDRLFLQKTTYTNCVVLNVHCLSLSAEQ